MEKKKILILGAGYGGVKAAKILNKRFKKNDNIEITIVDKNTYHTLLTELHEVAGTRVEPESTMVDLKKIFNATKVNVVTDVITGADYDKQELRSESNTYSYDYLVVGAGSEPADFGVPGVKDNGFTIWSQKDALRIKEHVENMFKKASGEKNANKRREMLTFVVAGAGFTGVEVIGELAEWRKRLCRENYIDEKEVTLTVVEALGKILPMINDKLIPKAEKKLRKLRVEVKTNSPITSVNKESIVLKDGTEIKTHTLIWTCGVQGSQTASDIGLKIAKRGRVAVNEYMQSTEHENVYVVGDVAYFEEDSKPLPQIVETAIQTGEAAAHNIVADIENTEKKPFKSNYHGIMVSIGSHYAVADVMGMSLSGFIAMGIKHLVNFHYLFTLAGFNQLATYILHEFFGVRDNRSFVGGHVANKLPIFWLVPLRLYVGAMWLYEAINKVNEGWLKSAKIFASTAAVSGASQASDTAKAAVATAAPLISKPFWIMGWIIDNFIAPHAVIFQTMIIGTEMALGLALIAGLFTTIASGVSVILACTFILSAMADKSILWYIFAGIALVGGAGRSAGLDYFVMPWLKNWWNGTLIARKFYLYVDKPRLYK